jgi:hypothetical protein
MQEITKPRADGAHFQQVRFVSYRREYMSAIKEYTRCYVNFHLLCCAVRLVIEPYFRLIMQRLGINNMRELHSELSRLGIARKGEAKAFPARRRTGSRTAQNEWYALHLNCPSSCASLFNDSNQPAPFSSAFNLVNPIDCAQSTSTLPFFATFFPFNAETKRGPCV